MRLCVEIGLGLATALEHLHKNGLVHRDIKPSNVVFIHGRVKLADIGMVSKADETTSVIGTDGYMPAQGQGSPEGDIFGLGRLLYEIFTGLSPLQFPDIPASFGAEKEDAEIARELNLIINKACAPKVNERHKNAAELRGDLLLAQSGHNLRNLRDAARRARMLKWFGVAAAVVAVFSVVGYFSARSANKRADANAIAALRNEVKAKEQARHANARLVDAKLAQARAIREAGGWNRRFEALKAVGEAAAICSLLSDIARNGRQ